MSHSITSLINSLKCHREAGASTFPTAAPDAGVKALPSDAVWLITGCSSGIGQALAQTVLKNGHRVVATARNPASLSYLPDNDSVLKVALEVTSNESVINAFNTAVERFGRIDVVVNNAGYSYYGDFEACAAPENEPEARREMETNFWGVVNCTREALRVFRNNPVTKGGVVVQVSSMGGMVGYPGNSFYHASKFAIEGLTESINKELPPDWNIQFLILEPGGVKTEYAKGSMKVLPPHEAYTGDNMPTRMLQKYMGDESMREAWAEPADLTAILFDVIKNKGERKMPFRLLLGRDAYGMVMEDLLNVVKEYKDWEGVSKATGTDVLEQKVDLEFMTR